MTFLDKYGAGTSPAGFSPVADPTPYVPPSFPVATRYDGASGDWLLDTNGEFKPSHPVDQGVALALCVKQGSFRYAPQVGNALGKVQLGGADLDGRVTDAVKTAVPLASYLADGSVTIRKIEYSTRPYGGLVVRVTYTNNLLDPGAEQTARSK